MEFHPEPMSEISRAPDRTIDAFHALRRDESAQEQAIFEILKKARNCVSACLQQQAIPPSLRKFFTSRNIQDMKSRRIEGNRYWLTTQALPDLYDHIRAVRDEFTDQLEIHFYHAALIIKIRREIDLTESLRAFRALWNAEGIFLIKLLSSRWIISALDSFADHGEPQERGNAMAIVTFFNMLKMADTEYQLCGQPNYDASRLDNNRDHYPLLWDGVRVFHIPDDDTFANMIRRMRRMLSTTPLFALIFEYLLNKVVHQNTMLKRLAQHHIRKLW